MKEEKSNLLMIMGRKRAEKHRPNVLKIECRLRKKILHITDGVEDEFNI